MPPPFSTKDTLKAAMRESLEANGVMNHIKAELRAAIFKSLCDATIPSETGSSGIDPNTSNTVTPTPPPENYLINELIKEYLLFNGLEHTLATFQLEAKVIDTQVPRKVIAAELKLRGAPAEIPLLYAMINECRQTME